VDTFYFKLLFRYPDGNLVSRKLAGCPNDMCPLYYLLRHARDYIPNDLYEECLI